MDPLHLVQRAAQVARRGEPTGDDVEWVASLLLPHELRLFSAAPGFDQLHAVAAARRVLGAVGDDPRWLRAALLHDTGKVRAGLGLVGRAVVTAAALAAPVRAARWEQRGEEAEAGNRVLDPARKSLRPAVYLAHGPVGAAWLARHGTEEEVTAWVRVHHRQDLWPETPIPTPVLRALAEADE